MLKRGLLPGLVVLSCGVVLGSLWAPGGFLGNALAQPGQSTTGSRHDEDLEAIKGAADKYCEAFNARDAVRLAQLFTEEAEFVDGSDHVVHGKKAIEEAFGEFFKANPDNKLVVDMDVVRRLGASTLVEEGTYSFEGQNGQSKTMDRSRYVILHVKQGNAWKIASIRCERDTKAAGSDQLKQLEWLVGSWVDEGANEVIRSNWKWSEDGSYLLGSFSVENKGQPIMKGTQRLGWDGSRKCIRSWVFDSEGGFTEGAWHKIAPGAWLVKGTGVNSDGETTSQTTVYESVSKDRFQLTMRDRVDGDAVLPDIVVTIVRAFPGPKQ